MSNIAFADVKFEQIEEIANFLIGMGIETSEFEIMAIIEEYEVEGYTEMEFNELIQIMIEKVRKVNEGKAIYDMFQLFDKDGNGYITPEELRSVMLSLGENLSDEVIDEMIDEADMNGDNQIDFFEFVKILSVEDDITLFTINSTQYVTKKEISSF
ncbi:Calmodulin [Oopsacas minuta]|uniref:Calmodulin n=1 Tax=Oopsacas minuta TaxID=111878 RepID=A0AAV7KGC4_9METZ|nr:Calmodulin [Oopsacas minuta]